MACRLTPLSLSRDTREPLAAASNIVAWLQYDSCFGVSDQKAKTSGGRKRPHVPLETQSPSEREVIAPGRRELPRRQPGLSLSPEPFPAAIETRKNKFRRQRFFFGGGDCLSRIENEVPPPCRRWYSVPETVNLLISNASCML